MTLKKTLIALGLVTIVAVGGVMAQATGKAPWQGHRAHRFEFVATYLDLTDAQKTQAKAIMQASHQATKPLAQQLLQGHQAMVEAVKANKSQADLTVIANAQAAIGSQIVVQKALAAEQFWALLTPDQQAKAEKLHDRFLKMFQDRIGNQ
jgi:Spy/CpxP family protein refolding chaperone